MIHNREFIIVKIEVKLKSISKMLSIHIGISLFGLTIWSIHHELVKQSLANILLILKHFLPQQPLHILELLDLIIFTSILIKIFGHSHGWHNLWMCPAYIFLKLSMPTS